MKLLIINADDFGYSRAVNYGIHDAHTLGMLTSTTMMTNMPGVDHAAELAHATPSLGVGVHLTLTCGRPLLEGHSTLTDDNGDFKNLKTYEGAYHLDQSELYEEWRAQIEKFYSYGLTPTHLDSHHHTNSYAQMASVFVKLAKEYKLPIRRNLTETLLSDNPFLLTTDYFDYHVEVLKKDPIELANHFGEAKTVEVMCHPAYLDRAIVEQSSFSYPRLDEIELLKNKEIIERLTSSNEFQFGTFRDLGE